MERVPQVFKREGATVDSFSLKAAMKKAKLEVSKEASLTMRRAAHLEEVKDLLATGRGGITAVQKDLANAEKALASAQKALAPVEEGALATGKAEPALAGLQKSVSDAETTVRFAEARVRQETLAGSKPVNPAETVAGRALSNKASSAAATNATEQTYLDALVTIKNVDRKSLKRAQIETAAANQKHRGPVSSASVDEAPLTDGAMGEVLEKQKVNKLGVLYKAARAPWDQDPTMLINADLRPAITNMANAKQVGQGLAEIDMELYFKRPVFNSELRGQQAIFERTPGGAGSYLLRQKRLAEEYERVGNMAAKLTARIDEFAPEFNNRLNAVTTQKTHALHAKLVSDQQASLVEAIPELAELDRTLASQGILEVERSSLIASRAKELVTKGEVTYADIARVRTEAFNEAHAAALENGGLLVSRNITQTITTLLKTWTRLWICFVEARCSRGK